MLRPSWSWIAIIVSAALIAMLAWQNRGLRQDRSELVDRIRYPYPGMYVPVVETRSLRGEPVALGRPAAQRQVLFFFNHTCPYCLASAPTVADAGRAIHRDFGESVEMFGVCDCTEAQASEYAARHRFEFPVVSLRDPRTLSLYRARTVPVLMVVDRDGRVRYALQNVFEGKERTHALLAALRNQRPTPAKETVASP